MDDFKQLFNELVRFETELWNAVDARLRAEHDLPLHRFEPMQIIDRTPECRVYDIADTLSMTILAASARSSIRSNPPATPNGAPTPTTVARPSSN